nr:IS3 family transposase [Spiroplasma tabanidicola]
MAYKIKDIFIKHNGIYRMPKIKIIVNNKGVIVSQTKVTRIMKIFKLYSIIRIKKMHRKQNEVKNITHDSIILIGFDLYIQKMSYELQM